MSSPMYDLPAHLAMPIDADGHGPADEIDAVDTVCWCGDLTCQRWRE